HLRRHTALTHGGFQLLTGNGDNADWFRNGLSGDASKLVEGNLLRTDNVDHVMAVDRVEQKLGGKFGDILRGDELRFQRSRDRSVDTALPNDRRQREKYVLHELVRAQRDNVLAGRAEFLFRIVQPDNRPRAARRECSCTRKLDYVQVRMLADHAGPGFGHAPASRQWIVRSPIQRREPE